MKCRFVPIILAALMAYVWAPRVEAEPIKIAGRSMSCGSTPVLSDSSLPMEGMYVPGRGIYLNHNLMKRHPEAVRMFVFKHECAHKTVGGNELAADCAAAQSGARDGWLTQAGVDSVCKSLAGQPAGGRYPSGTKRCANIRKCYANSSERVAQQNSDSQKAAGSGRLRATN
jgi:hypothetical protein